MPAPSANVSASARPGVTTSARRQRRERRDRERASSPGRRSRNARRSTMSAIEPMTSASSTAGTLLAVWTRAIRVGESDSAAITVTAPTVFIQITSCEPASARPRGSEAGPAQRRERRLVGGRGRRGGEGAVVMGSNGAANECIIAGHGHCRTREPGAAVTLRDVARVAGVHPATVSRALNAETRRSSTRRPRGACSRPPRSSATSRTRSRAG